MLINSYLYDSTQDEDFQRYMWKYGLFVVQLYCGSRILKATGKSFFKNLPNYKPEYVLKYTYSLSFITLIASYSYLLETRENILMYGNVVGMDIVGNGVLVISSYYFHNNWYKCLRNNNNYSIANNTHKKYLLFDIAAIDFKILTQYVCHMEMHNYAYDTYKMYAMILFISFVIELAIIDSIYCYHIQKNMKLSNNADLYLTMIMGFFPAVGILLSTINISDTDVFLDTMMHIFLISSVMYIKPLYNSTQILVHVLICFTGYQLVLNNTYYIRN
mgnify:CR=1 FL=1|tara:strand:- start:422 stop:1243 length:822 start_codon:yes stop_codon:yes gene_type:complete